MKALCTGIIGDNASFKMIGEKPLPGTTYVLEQYYEGTQAQNKAFHALCMEYFRSGMHSYNSDSFDDFRNQIKRSLGAGFTSFVYIDEENGVPCMKDSKTYLEIPEHIRDSPDRLHLIRGKLKSWTDYTKRERKSAIDNLISEMRHAGINSKMFEEIISGMGGDN